MKSPWKVTSNTINGEKVYGVYRQLDTDKVDHSGNREYVGGFTPYRDAAQALAGQLNTQGDAAS